MERVPFDVAISDAGLLKGMFESLSWPQQITLKAFYGCNLDPERVNPTTGFSELDYWAIIQGSCEYDHLGYVTKVIPISYYPKEYNQLWAIVGRRAGKTSNLMAPIIAYEATLGGHEEYVQKEQENAIYLIAHRLNLAQANLNFIRSILRNSPVLRNELIDGGAATEIRLKNGISILASPPSLKAQRGFAIPVVGMDEVGFWYTDPDAANPDVEVEAAVRYAQMQFPFNKRIGISTPWTEEGLLYKYFKAGTEGSKLSSGADKSEFEDVLTVFAPTAAFENPRLTRKALERIHREDPDKYQRESLCKFLDSVSGFFSSRLITVAAAKGEGVVERAPASPKDKIQPIYIAAMDPAFRHDDFAFCILHKDQKQNVVVDVLRQFTPLQGQKLNPRVVLEEIAQICKLYGIQTVHSDQYQLESLEQLAMDYDIAIHGTDFTATSKSKIYGSLQQVLNQQKLVLLDEDLSDPAQTLVRQLKILERHNTQGGRIQITAPSGKHDDMPTVLALATHHAMWLDPVEVAEDEYREPTIHQRCMETLARRRAFLEGDPL